MPPMRLNSARVTRACLQASGLAVLGFALSLCPVALSSQAAWAADGTTESEWFMRVEVTPENSVVVRQEKEGERYLLDESEMHDRAMTPAEVDVAIADFVNSVKTRQKVK